MGLNNSCSIQPVNLMMFFGSRASVTYIMLSCPAPTYSIYRSLSYVLLLAGFGYLLLAGFYLIIDVLPLWNGVPFIYPGSVLVLLNVKPRCENYIGGVGNNIIYPVQIFGVLPYRNNFQQQPVSHRISTHLLFLLLQTTFNSDCWTPKPITNCCACTWS